MHIRELTAQDYDAVVAVWSDAQLPHRPGGRDARPWYEAEVERETAIFLGAEVDGVLAGVVLGTHDGRKGWINRLAVRPMFRLRGIGKALVAEVERRIVASGIQIVTCLIEGENDASKRFFESLGYLGHHDITYYAKRWSAEW
jgi:N-acetylglutamate synthase